MNKLLPSFAGLLLSALLASGASAGDRPTTFANDHLHFEVPQGVFVSTNTITSPEGPVRIIRLQPADPNTGQALGHSFMLIAHFSAASGEISEEMALSSIADGAIAALSRFATLRESSSSVSIAELSLDARQWTATLEDATATITAASHVVGEDIFVLYSHISDADGELTGGFNTARNSITFGALPEAEPEEVDPERRRFLGLPPLPDSMRVNDR